MSEVTRETVEAIRAKQQNDADEDWLMDFFAARDAVYALLTFIAQQDARLLDQAREIDSIRAERDRLRKYIGEMPYADEWPAVQERLAQQDARIEELDAAIGQQAVDLAHQDVRIAELESEVLDWKGREWAMSDAVARVRRLANDNTFGGDGSHCPVSPDEIRAALDGKA